MPDRDPVIRVTAMPADANAYGDIFGGWLMSQLDMPYHGDRGEIRRGGRRGIAAANYGSPSSRGATCARRRGVLLSYICRLVQ